MKKVVLVLMLFSSLLIFSQEVDLKKGIVYIDGKECFKYESDSNNITYQNLNGDDIMILKYIRPDGTQSSLYAKVIFIETNQELTSKYIFTKKALIEKLLKSKAIEECALNEDKVANFVLKFDEKIENRMNNNTTNTIIIKEEPRKSGVNINLGR